MPSATVPRHLVQLQLAHLGQDFRQRFGRAARRVLFEAMVHFDDFQIEVRAQNFRRLAREPEQRVDAGRKIRRPRPSGICDLNFVIRDLFGVGMSGGADDHGFFVPGAKLGDVRAWPCAN